MHCSLRNGRLTTEDTETFIAYGAGTLSPEAEASLLAHLEGCADCQRLADAQRKVWSAMDAWTPAALSSNFDERLYARIAAEQMKPWWRRTLADALDRLSLNWSWKPAMPVAAACAVLFGAFLLKSPVPEQQSTVSVQPRVDIEQVERALDDLDMLKQIGVAAPV